MANVQVMGGVSTEGGLKEAQAVQRRHNAEVADALLNISGVGTATGEPAHKDDARPAYKHQQFPKMLYKPLPGIDGEKVVMSDVEMAVAVQNGWREEPYPRAPQAIHDPAQEKKELLDTNQRLQSQLIQQAELMEKMAARLEAIEKSGKKKGE